MTYREIVFALNDPTRRAIFERICESPISPGELSRQRGVSQPAISQHIKILRAAGLIAACRLNRKVMYQSRPDALTPLQQYLERCTGTPPSSDLPADIISEAALRWAQEWPEQNADVYAISMRLLQLGRHTDRALRETAEKKSLQGNELLVLDALNLSDGQCLTPSQLRERLGVTKGAITKILDRLESMGLIQRHAQAGDRRAILIRPTPKARGTLDAILSHMQYGADHAAVRRLDSTEMAQLSRLLHKLHLLVNEELNSPSL